jgi:hypothetical protein
LAVLKQRVFGNQKAEAIMIPNWKVKAIESLLAERQLSHRQIAKQLKVWRGTVSRIADKTRPDYDALRQTRESDSVRIDAPPARCTTCGARVYPPCIACHAHLETASGRRPFKMVHGSDSKDALQLKLNDKQKARYDEVRSHHARHDMRAPRGRD